MTWVEKYRPKKLDEVKGQDLAIAKVKRFVAEFNIGRMMKRGKKALVLHGPPGTGKTTIAHAIACETNSEIFELNASDLRNKSNLQEVLKPAIEQQSLIKKNKIILVDEVDGISGYYDKGGIPELLQLITITHYPIIITANDIWKKNLNPIRQKSELVQLKEIKDEVTTEILIDILRREDLFIEHGILKSIALNSNGDLRAAINDLQTIVRTKTPSATEIDERNKEVDIFRALKKIFKEKPDNELLNLFESVNMSLDDIILWIEENIPEEYSGKELARAYELLAKVDLFRGRIYKQQYWRFLVYENLFLSYGISASKKYSNKKFTTYKRPTRVLKIWLNNQKKAKIKSIAQKYAKLVHIGEKRAIHEFPIIKHIIKSNPKIQKELRLDGEEIEYLGKIEL